MTEKFIEYLEEAERTIKTCDHITYVTFPLIKDKKLLLKILLELKKALAYEINATLQHEYLFKRIKLHKDPKANLNTFLTKTSKTFQINEEEKQKIIELFKLADAKKRSSMEFVRKENVVILSENLEQKTINLQIIKEFLQLCKNILKKIKKKITL